MKRYARRKKFKVKKLFILLFTVMLCVMAGKVLHSSLTTPFLGNITHHMASEDHGWNLILVNRENYIPADYEVQLTELSNGKKVDSRICPELQEMFNAARAVSYTHLEQYEKNEKKKRMLNLQKTQQLMEIDNEIEQNKKIIDDFTDTILQIHEFIMGNKECSFSIQTIDKARRKTPVELTLRIYDDGSHKMCIRDSYDTGQPF